MGHFVLPGGLEPPSLAAHGPKPCASAIPPRELNQHNYGLKTPKKTINPHKTYGFLLTKSLFYATIHFRRFNNFYKKERMVLTMRTLLTILSVVIIAVVGLIIGIITGIWLGSTAGTWFGIGIALALAGLFICTGLVEVKANPPHIGVVTLMGKRMDSTLDEGIRFLPFNKVLYDVIQIGIVKKNLDFSSVRFRTPDRAELEAKISLTVIPSKKHIVNFLDSGEWSGIKNILQDAISERIRTWGISPKEGPANWVEAQASGDEALALILKSLFGDKIGSIPSDIPTSLLIKFFSTSEEEVIKDAEAKGLTGEEKDKAIAWYKNVERQLGSEDYDKVKAAIERRLKIVADIRHGTFKQDIPDLGVRIVKANVSDIHVIGVTATAAELEAKEIQEKAAEVAEIEHIKDLANRLKNALNITAEQAMEIVMIERGKMTRNVEDKKISFTMSPELLDAAKALLNLFDKKGGSN